MQRKLENKKVAIVVADGFEQSEFEKPVETLVNEGAIVVVVSFKRGKVKAWKEKKWGDDFTASLAIDEAYASDFDAVLLPGGVMNPDKLRQNSDVVAFVKSMYNAGKPIAAICHGPWTLIETGIVKGKTMTSYPSLKTDLINAGANWVDEEVVVDNGLITSRSAKDLPAFCKKLVEEIREGVHA